MYYNLIDFGKRVLDIRNANKLTREQLSELSLVSTSTIRKIETGKHLPTHEILDELSNVLKIDLNKLLLNYRLDDYEEFNKIKNRLESKFDGNQYNTLHIEHSELKILLNSTPNAYYRKHISQLILFIESMILYKIEENYVIALENFIESIKISLPNFRLEDYSNFFYNVFEIRILMNIALVLNYLDKKNLSLEILTFCFNITDLNNEIYPKLSYNISTQHRLKKNYILSLEYSNLGIDYCEKNRNLNGLNFLYYNKALAEKLLGHISYRDSLNKALSFCDILGQDELKKVLIHKCKKFYDINL